MVAIVQIETIQGSALLQGINSLVLVLFRWPVLSECPPMAGLQMSTKVRNYASPLGQIHAHLEIAKARIGSQRVI
jgi:hypothetical protein